MTLDAVDPDVLTMFQRFEGYLSGREPLPSMACFCLSMLANHLSYGRKEAAARYGISRNVLGAVANLVSEEEGPTAAGKATGIEHDLTQEEDQFLEEAVRLIIQRVAAVAQDPQRPLRQITMADLPELSGDTALSSE